MNVLKKCCYRSLKGNRKRTVVTVMGIMLATALITGVACMAVSFRESMIAYEKMRDGDYHYCFSGVGYENLKYFENNAQIEKYGLTAELGYAWLDGSQNPDKPYVYVRGMDKTAEEVLSLQLTEGRMPENDKEVVIGGHIRSNGFVDLKVGDELVLKLGSRVSEGKRLNQRNPYLYEEEELEPEGERTYTIVGIVRRPIENAEPLTAPGYSVFTRIENLEEAESLDVFVSYTDWGLRHRNQVTAGILGVPEELYLKYCGGYEPEKLSQRYYGEFSSCTEEETAQIRAVAEVVNGNYWVLKWELLIFASNTMNMMYAVAAVAIIVIVATSICCIHNSFVISLTEKIRLYGRLSSVGTTARQQRKIVYYEAFFLGAAGIPLGIMCGAGATAVLVKAVGGMVEDAAGFPLIFAFSLPAMLFAAVLSAVTVLLSASRSAKRAAGLSPVSAIQASDTVKIKKKEMRCPGIVGKLFGIGGRIAFKNLKRARVKYRTTVISIVVSVAVFIGMSTFVGLLFDVAGIYNWMPAYQIEVEIYSDDYEAALEIAQLEGVEEAEVVRSGTLAVDMTQVPYSKEYRDSGRVPDEEDWALMREQGIEADEEIIMISFLGKEAFARFCERAGVSVEEARDKAVIIADFSLEHWEGSGADKRLQVERYEIAEYKRGDVIRGRGSSEGFEIQVAAQTSEKPMFLQNPGSNKIEMIVSDELMDCLPETMMIYDNINVYIRCEDSDSLEEVIRGRLELMKYTLTNYDARIRANRSLYLVVAIFLYGFITVVALIGITNIFNTITTNMELRAPEFAMLESVGMTGREFRRMIWLEGMFYGGKALLIGIPLGLLISWWFHLALGRSIVMEFHLPWMAVLTASAAVLLLLFVIMHYSMAKINRRNIIETIQNENI